MRTSTPRVVGPLAAIVLVALLAAGASIVVSVRSAQARGCPLLRYWFDTAAATPHVADGIQGAFASLAGVTGMEVVDDRANPDGWLRGPLVVIEFGNINGMTGRRSLGRAIPQWQDRGPVAGVIRLNTGAPPPAEVVGAGVWRHVVMHELGHLLRLGHSENEADVMYGKLDHRAHDWSPADVERLKRAGAELGCEPPR